MDGLSISQYEATLHMGITNLSGRVSELRKEGHPIVNEWHTSETGTRYSRYRYQFKAEEQKPLPLGA